MTTQFPLPGLPAADPGADLSAGVGEGEEAPRRRGPSREELLAGLNEPQREAVVHEGSRCSWSPAPARARPAC